MDVVQRNRRRRPAVDFPRTEGDGWYMQRGQEEGESKSNLYCVEARLARRGTATLQGGAGREAVLSVDSAGTLNWTWGSRWRLGTLDFWMLSVRAGKDGRLHTRGNMRILLRC